MGGRPRGADGDLRRPHRVVHQLVLRGHDPGRIDRPAGVGARPAGADATPHHPRSEQVRATIERDGVLDDLVAIGATVLANACGPCIGQWDRPAVDPSTSTRSSPSFNRNFPPRNDGNAATKAFLASPEMVDRLRPGRDARLRSSPRHDDG